MAESGIFAPEQATSETLREYDTIVLVSCVCMGKLSALGFLVQNWSALIGKRVAVVGVGLILQDRPSGKQDYDSIPQEIRTAIRYFKVPGKCGPANPHLFNRRNLQPVIDFLRDLEPVPRREVIPHLRGPGVAITYRIVRGQCHTAVVVSPLSLG